MSLEDAAAALGASKPSRPAPKVASRPPPRTKPSGFAVGARVECRHGGGSTFYPGVVVAANEGAYDIDYDDGDKERGVAAALMKAEAAPEKPAPLEKEASALLEEPAQPRKPGGGRPARPGVTFSAAPASPRAPSSPRAASATSALVGAAKKIQKEETAGAAEAATNLRRASLATEAAADAGAGQKLRRASLEVAAEAASDAEEAMRSAAEEEAAATKARLREAASAVDSAVESGAEELVRSDAEDVAAARVVAAAEAEAEAPAEAPAAAPPPRRRRREPDPPSDKESVASLSSDDAALEAKAAELREKRRQRGLLALKRGFAEREGDVASRETHKARARYLRPTVSRADLTARASDEAARALLCAFDGDGDGLEDAVAALGFREGLGLRCALVADRAAKESEIPNFKGSDLGRFPLVSADFWTSDHPSERSRSVDAFLGTRARNTYIEVGLKI